jgi:hypothetical protein
MPGSAQDDCVELKDLRAMLEVHHVRGLEPLQQKILAGRCCGGATPKALAEVLDYSEQHVSDLFRRVEDIVLTPLGLPRNLATMTHWFNLHLRCEVGCISHAEMLVENRRVYARQ